MKAKLSNRSPSEADKARKIDLINSITIKNKDLDKWLLDEPGTGRGLNTNNRGNSYTNTNSPDRMNKL